MLRKFMADSIERVISKKDWAALSYTPDLNHVLKNQNKFLDMLNDFKFKHVRKFNPINFYLPEAVGVLCRKHHVYLHKAGCVICNDESSP